MFGAEQKLLDASGGEGCQVLIFDLNSKTVIPLMDDCTFFGAQGDLVTPEKQLFVPQQSCQVLIPIL